MSRVPAVYPPYQRNMPAVGRAIAAVVLQMPDQAQTTAAGGHLAHALGRTESALVWAHDLAALRASFVDVLDRLSCLPLPLLLGPLSLERRPVSSYVSR